ncbi:MAG: GNAT family N-acetyltransferase [Spirochaetales bacterium]|nr:GNAT family N-acetyltransferase [Spirochaetales bacterium]
MAEEKQRLYRLTRKDIKKAGIVFADAFSHDPVWRKVLEEIPLKRKQAFFQNPARFGIWYGKAYAPSKNIEGIAVWLPGEKADITISRAIRCGAFFPSLKLGMKNLMRMGPIFNPLEEDRKRNMQGKQYLYLIIIGVASELQHRGFGGQLLKALIDESENTGTPVYLETATEKNVKMYEKYGFKVIGKMTHPYINVSQWEMFREVSFKK